MKINVKKVSGLAKLTLTTAEEEKLSVQLSKVLDYINKLNELKTERTTETSQVTGLENVTRADNTVGSLPQNEALSGTKSKKDGFFQVEGVLKNG